MHNRVRDKANLGLEAMLEFVDARSVVFEAEGLLFAANTE